MFLFSKNLSVLRNNDLNEHGLQQLFPQQWFVTKTFWCDNYIKFSFKGFDGFDVRKIDDHEYTVEISCYFLTKWKDDRLVLSEEILSKRRKHLKSNASTFASETPHAGEIKVFLYWYTWCSQHSFICSINAIAIVRIKTNSDNNKEAFVWTEHLIRWWCYISALIEHVFRTFKYHLIMRMSNSKSLESFYMAYYIYIYIYIYIYMTELPCA